MFWGSQGKDIGECKCCLFSQKLKKTMSWKGKETAMWYRLHRMPDKTKPKLMSSKTQGKVHVSSATHNEYSNWHCIIKSDVP